MLEYLVNYGVKSHTFNIEDVDIFDVQRIQAQINEVRNKYKQLIILLDEVQGKHLEVTAQMSKLAKNLIESNGGVRSNNIFSNNDDYLELEAQEAAYKAGMNMINASIEFYKSDLRILNSTFYNKF